MKTGLGNKKFDEKLKEKNEEEEVDEVVEQSGTNWRLGGDGKVYHYGKRIYPNGDDYEGEMVGGKKYGKGLLKFADGSIYNGYFQDDKFYGKGKKIWASFTTIEGVVIPNKTYEGEWKHGLFDGKGILHYGSNQGNYIGYFQQGYYHGEGTWTKPDKSIIKGIFTKGIPTGIMHIKYINGTIYQGYLRDRRYHGHGKLIFANNFGSYDGEWRSGMKHGKGTRIFSNGNKYIGQFVNDQIEGEGVMSYINGDIYNGSWYNGYYHGKGNIRYNHGDSYEGDFYMGFKYGEGTYHYADGGQYSGDFKNMRLYKGIMRPLHDSKRHGYGVRTWTNGSVYEGEWAQNLMEGKGVLTTIFGSKYVGTFRLGKRNGQGIQEYGNKLNIPFVCPFGYRHKGEGYCVYTGDFVEDELHGRGELKCVDGRCYSGEWVQGKRTGEGAQVLVCSTEKGDPKRQFIGPNGSLYRVSTHVGLFKDNVREGYGISIYTNGHQLLGEFRNGMPHGIIVCKYPSGRSRLAQYDMGKKVQWIDGSMKDEDMLDKFNIDLSRLRI